MGRPICPTQGIAFAFPDVCKTPTPGGPVPIPYPNVANSIMAAIKVSKRVTDNKQKVVVKGAAYSLSNGDQLSIGLRLLQSNSDDPDLDFTRYGIEARYYRRKPVMNTKLEFGLSAFQKDHDRSDYSADGRSETELTAEITAVFQTLTYYGFVPAVTLRASRTDSNIGLYDVEELGLRMSIRSAF